MASASKAKSVDASLWWDSFTHLLTELENVSISSDIPPSLMSKVKDNHAWFLDTVSLFKPPNQKSKEALDANLVNIGSHQLTIEPELKDLALKVSSVLCLDEVQSYIITKRSIEHSPLAVDFVVHELLHSVIVQYYIERQCLLKCTRQIVIHALDSGTGSKEGDVLMNEATKLISDGLEDRLLSVLEDLLLSSYPEHMDVDLFTLWAEETLVEDNLVLDILFLAYYESFCTCNGKQWKKLCLIYEGTIAGSYNFGRLAISAEAIHSIYQAKVQLLLILIETLDLECLLQLIHEETPFRQGSTAFSLIDVQEMDAIILGFNVVETKEAGPLILAWAVFLCLISSLPGKQENDVIMEIDHVGYVRQAFEVSSLNYFLEILQSDVLQDSDVPVAGYRSVLRTFVSAFIASYEISLQLEDNNLKLILDILCKIYCGEESLCIQFWDRESYIDGPIRCLLCNLEGEFPFETVELVRLLSALCEGAWPAECVYNFLDKSVGLSSVFEMRSNSAVDTVAQIVETEVPLHVPGVEGLLIPSKTRGHVLKMVDEDKALVRWEYTQSGVLVLLLRFAQELYLNNTEEILVTLELFSRLASFNMAVCHALMDAGSSFQEKGMGRQIGNVNVVEVICTLVKKLSPSSSGAVMMSMGVNTLVEMLKCSPSNVSMIALKANIFDVALRTNPFGVSSDGLSSGSWLLSGRLMKMLLVDCEHDDSCGQLTLSVLDFTMQLMETGVENDVVLALIVFSLQYVLVNHEYWKYKVKQARWKVTLKVLELVKKCISTVPYCHVLGEPVRDILLCDSSIHNFLFRIACTTTQTLEKLYVCRLYELVEIEGLQLAISSVLDILFSMLHDLSKENLPSLPVFHQAMLSSTATPIPIVVAIISLISCFRDPKIQVGALRVVSVLFEVADYSESYAFGNACFGLDEKQIANLRSSLYIILCEKSPRNEELIISAFKLLTSAACYQPAFLTVLIGSKEIDIHSSTVDDVKQPNSVTNGLLVSNDTSLLDAILQFVARSGDLMKSNPYLLLGVLNFLKSLWQGATHFTYILERVKNSEKFWSRMSDSILLDSVQDHLSENLSEKGVHNSAYRYQCQSCVLQIMACEIFLQKKLLDTDLLKQTSELSKNGTAKADSSDKTKDARPPGLEDILSTCCESSVLANLIKALASCDYDNDTYVRAKIAAGLFVVHVMGKFKDGDLGSLSVSLIGKIRVLSEKLGSRPAFAELLSQYAKCGYSEGKELNGLIIDDLYYHLQGELEGRKIDHRSFKELSQYLVETNFLQAYRQKYDNDFAEHAKDVYLFDAVRLRADLGLDLWDISEWKASKGVAERMLISLHDVNSMVLLTSSKLHALKALIAVIALSDENLTEKISEELIEHTCLCLHATVESLAPASDASGEIIDFLATQASLLNRLIRSVDKKLSLPICLHILKTSALGLKVLRDFRPSVASVKTTVNLLIFLVLSSLELSLDTGREMESIDAFAEVSTTSLGLIPILCSYIERADHCTLSLTTIDWIVKGFSSPASWFPIIQEHLRLQHLVLKLQDKTSVASSVPIILKFFLTIARVKGGAEMLLNAGFFSYLGVIFADLLDGNPVNSSNSGDGIEKPRFIWGLGLAVVTAMIQSLGDNSYNDDIVDQVMNDLFFEKAYLISHHLSAPEFLSHDHDRKRSRPLRKPNSLSALKETELTLVLMCVLSKHQKPWNKTMKEVDSQLREKCIHFLAFISRGNHRVSEFSSKMVPFLCHPVLKEEIEWYKKAAFVNSKNGWFSLSPIGCELNPKFCALSSRATALIVKDQAAENGDLAHQTCFSDAVAIQLYRIGFLLLKFLCLQADSAAKRAEEVGFIDPTHFPELPVPDILHGLQDQGIAIVTELCEANQMKQVSQEIRGVCNLLLQITTMSLYLEFCVSQVCGIRLVSGRVEEFLKELKFLLRAAEGHAFLKEAMKSLKQIISFVYPELLKYEGLL